jgi:hypothetical protein
VVLNPLIEAVDYETHLLGRGSLTWAFYIRGPERLKPIADYMGGSSRALEDLMRARPEIQAPLEQHDEMLERATAAATKAHDALLATPEFARLVMSKLEQYEKGRTPPKPPPSGAFDADQLPLLVADRLVNNDDEVGGRYTDAEFWNMNRQAFMELASGPEFVALRSTVAGFLRQDRELLTRLKDWHFELVEEFDVEPV